jgi:lipoprotein signal peptidase
MGCGLLIRSDEMLVLNLADSAIVVGAGLLVLEILFAKSHAREDSRPI